MALAGAGIKLHELAQHGLVGRLDTQEVAQRADGLWVVGALGIDGGHLFE
jgi:hypothetical protein